MKESHSETPSIWDKLVALFYDIWLAAVPTWRGMWNLHRNENEIVRNICNKRGHTVHFTGSAVQLLDIFEAVTGDSDYLYEDEHTLVYCDIGLLKTGIPQVTPLLLFQPKGIQPGYYRVMLMASPDTVTGVLPRELFEDGYLSSLLFKRHWVSSTTFTDEGKLQVSETSQWSPAVTFVGGPRIVETDHVIGLRCTGCPADIKEAYVSRHLMLTL